MELKELQERQVGLGMNNKQFASFLGIHEKSWSRIKRHGVVTPRFEKKLAGVFRPNTITLTDSTTTINGSNGFKLWGDGTGYWSADSNHWATKDENPYWADTSGGWPKKKPSLIDRIKGWFKW